MALTTQQKLNEARDAYHRLLTGQAEVDVTFDDRRVRFTEMNKEKLEAYIEELEVLVAAVGEPDTRRVPIRVLF